LHHLANPSNLQRGRHPERSEGSLYLSLPLQVPLPLQSLLLFLLSSPKGICFFAFVFGFRFFCRLYLLHALAAAIHPTHPTTKNLYHPTQTKIPRKATFSKHPLPQQSHPRTTQQATEPL